MEGPTTAVTDADFELALMRQFTNVIFRWVIQKLILETDFRTHARFIKKRVNDEAKSMVMLAENLFRGAKDADDALAAMVEDEMETGAGEMVKFVKHIKDHEQEQAATRSKLRVAVIKELLMAKDKLDKRGLKLHFANRVAQEMKDGLEDGTEAAQVIATGLRTLESGILDQEFDETLTLLRNSDTMEPITCTTCEELQGTMNRSLDFFCSFNEATSDPDSRPGGRRDEKEESDEEDGTGEGDEDEEDGEDDGCSPEYAPGNALLPTKLDVSSSISILDWKEVIWYVPFLGFPGEMEAGWVRLVPSPRNIDWKDGS